MQLTTFNLALLVSWACLFCPIGQSARHRRVRVHGGGGSGGGGDALFRPGFAVRPRFEDPNGTTVFGEPGGDVVMDCNIFMLQDHVVSWVHKSPTDGSVDLLTLGNSTHTLEPRVSLSFSHPSNWALRIADLTPADAGPYLCQISTFPEETVRTVFLEIRGPMIEIVRSHDRDQPLLYNAGSHLEVRCRYRNTTRTTVDVADSSSSSDVMRVVEASRRRLRQRQRQGTSSSSSMSSSLPEDAIRWLHDGKRFSHRNRRRVKTVWHPDHILSILSIKSAILEDSGNYSCILPASNHSDTVRLTVVDGEHSAAIYKNGGDVSPVASGATSHRDSLVAMMPVVVLMTTAKRS